MNTATFSEWLEKLPLSSRIVALAFIYSDLTVGTRAMFFPEWTMGKARRERALEILHGLNEIHHTLSNQLMAYATGECNRYSIQAFSKMLAEIESKYRLEEFLTPAIVFAQSRSFWTDGTQ